MSETISIETLLAQRDWLEGVSRALIGDAADDAVQDAYLAALQSPPPSDRPVRPWLLRVTRNAARMTARSESRRRVRDEASSVHGEAAPDPSRALAQAHAVDCVTQHLAALDEPLRQVLLLRYGQAMSSAEIAELLAVPAGTIRWRLKKAIDELRERMDRDAGGDRRAWQLALVPLVGASSPKVAGAVTLGTVLAMKTTTLFVGTLLVGAIAAGTTLVLRDDATAAVPTASAAEPDGAAENPQPASSTKARPGGEKLKLAAAKARHRAMLRRLEVARAQREKRAREAAMAAPAAEPMSEAERAELLKQLETYRPALDPEYIQESFQEIVPMVRECYDMALERSPGLGGTMVVEFAIVGEEEIGGLVEYSLVNADESTLSDPGMTECVGETIYALELPPPEDGGRVVVNYPIVFQSAAPDEPHPDGDSTE